MVSNTPPNVSVGKQTKVYRELDMKDATDRKK